MSWKLTEAGKTALRDIKKGKLKVSWPQQRCLEDVRDHGDPWRRIFGGAAHGGMFKTMNFLQHKKKWIRWEL
jgi:hypothetical protein